MKKLENIKNSIDGIGAITKCVAEFIVYDDGYTPWSKFKVKIFEYEKNFYSGRTTVAINTDDDYPFPLMGMGDGHSIEETLIKTIENFLTLITDKNAISDSDYCFTDTYFI